MGPLRFDDYTKRVKGTVDFYRDIRSISDEEVAQLARSDCIDIAIDLMGYTQDSRPSIFSYRTAPVQISFLGYPGTMGSDCHDYLIADETLIPKDSQKYYSEKILYMPNTYQCNDNTKTIAKKKYSRKELGLPADGFVFTCFNANFKINPPEFEIWMNLLGKIPGSVLWLLSSNTNAQNNLRKYASSFSIDPNRLIFANKCDLPNHLSRHSCGDLFLDTFNYNAHTTASDALWAGLPVLTFIGRSFSSRVTASLLMALDMPELITTSPEQYQNLAYKLATNPQLLSVIRNKLLKNKNMKSLFNSKMFTCDFERILLDTHDKK